MYITENNVSSDTNNSLPPLQLIHSNSVFIKIKCSKNTYLSCVVKSVKPFEKHSRQYLSISTNFQIAFGSLSHHFWPFGSCWMEGMVWLRPLTCHLGDFSFLFYSAATPAELSLEPDLQNSPVCVTASSMKQNPL